VDSKERKLLRKVNKAASALRKALRTGKTPAECNRLAEELARAQRELANYQLLNP
jgi:hypothetical protein